MNSHDLLSPSGSVTVTLPRQPGTMELCGASGIASYQQLPKQKQKQTKETTFASHGFKVSLNSRRIRCRELMKGTRELDRPVSVCLCYGADSGSILKLHCCYKWLLGDSEPAVFPIPFPCTSGPHGYPPQEMACV